MFTADHFSEDDLSEVSSLEETKSLILIAFNCYSSSFGVNPCEISLSHVEMPASIVTVGLA